jgi:hypothetical protein
VKILGIGLSKTGTTSLHRALGILGLRSLHHDETRLNDVLAGSHPAPGFRYYDDLDAVLDIPTAFFFPELLAAYPECRGILTIRDEDGWWRSIEEHFNHRSPVRSREENPFKWDLRMRVYGSARATESLFRARYRAHNARVLESVSPERLLVMDVAAGDGWDVLCPFLGLPQPPQPFPHQNSDASWGETALRAATAELAAVVAPGARFALIDEGWLDSSVPCGARSMPFLERDGLSQGRPADDAAALRELERLRCAGAAHLVFTWPTFWWFDHYRAFAGHLESCFRRVIENDRLVVFDLGEPKAS